MKHILTSQRVDIVADYNEKRDCLDQRWTEFLHACDCILIPVPNHAENLRAILKSFKPDGILLTGGNSPVLYGGNSSERDGIDAFLLGYAVSARIPLMGVCRGMQSIVLHFGGTLKKIDGHVAVKHIIEYNVEVNSYHTLAADYLPDTLAATAHSNDNAIEALRHVSLPIEGIMWHPERNQPFDERDIGIFQKIYNHKEMKA
jgi:putative glutamine amidotransferase